MPITANHRKSKFRTIAPIIIALAVVAFIVYNSRTGDDFEVVQKQADKDSASEVILNSDTSDNTLFQTPTPTIEAKVEGIATRKVQLYLDTNNDGTRNSAESGCNLCVSKTLIAGEELNSVLPAVSSFKQVSIGAEGTLKDTDFGSSNITWGYFPDRKVLVPPTLLLLNDGTTELQIAAKQIKVSIDGINANIERIKIEGTQTKTVIYEFEYLLPALQSALENNKPVWVQYIPDKNNPANYYLQSNTIKLDSTGNVTGVEGRYYLELDWAIPGSTSALTSKESIQFGLL